MFSAALCDLPAGDNVASDSARPTSTNSRWTVSTPILPLSDRPAILGAMAKTADAARQQWVRDKQPSMTEVMEQYSKDGRHA